MNESETQIQAPRGFFTRNQWPFAVFGALLVVCLFLGIWLEPYFRQRRILNGFAAKGYIADMETATDAKSALPDFLPEWLKKRLYFVAKREDVQFFQPVEFTEEEIKRFGELPFTKALRFFRCRFPRGYWKPLLQNTTIKHLSFRAKCSLDDADLADWPEMPHLQELGIEALVTEAALPTLLEKTPNLSRFFFKPFYPPETALFETDFSSRFGAAFTETESADENDLFEPIRLERLESLFLRSASARTLKLLRHCPNLRFLYMNNCRLTDAEIPDIAALTKLAVLNVANAGDLTDAGLAPLAGLTSLEEIQLSGTQVTGAGLLHLKDLPNLKELALNGTDVDVSVLEILSEFSRPLTVSITTYEKEFPEETLKKFRAGHPHLEIYYNLNMLPK